MTQLQENRPIGEINENREFWCDKVNFHLKNILKRAKRDNKFQRHMATHCYTRNQVSKVKIKQLKKILQETLIRQKEKVKLDLLADASLRAIQDKDKKPMHDEGPSGEHEADFILIQDDDPRLVTQCGEGQMDHQVFGVEKQVAGGSTSDHGAKKHS